MIYINTNIIISIMMLVGQHEDDMIKNSYDNIYKSVLIKSDDVKEKSSQKWSLEQCCEVYSVTYSSGSSIAYKKDTNYILEYQSNIKENEYPPNVLIDEKKAIEMAHVFLKRIEHSESLVNIHAECIDLGTRIKSTEKSNNKKRWEIRGEYEYMGIECFGRGIVISISAYTGQVISYINRQILIPEKMKASISKEKAIEYGKQWIDNKYKITTTENNDECNLVIINYNDWESNNINSTEDCNVHLCWKIIYSYGSNEVNDIMIFVDAISGSVGCEIY